MKRKSQIVLGLDQCLELKKLGFRFPCTVLGWYYKDDMSKANLKIIDGRIKDNYIPAPTLQEFIDCLPKEFIVQDPIVSTWDTHYVLTLENHHWSYRVRYWNGMWGDYEGKWFDSKQPIFAVFELTKWLLENGKI